MRTHDAANWKIRHRVNESIDPGGKAPPALTRMTENHHENNEAISTPA